MPEQTQTMLDLDWEELLLEIQTDPGDGLSESHGRLYQELYGMLTKSAQIWLRSRGLSEVEDGALVAIGIDKIFRNIAKFAIPNDCSAGIGRAFKAWCLTCCRREWSKSVGSLRNNGFEPEIDTTDVPSPEDILMARESSELPPGRPQADKELMRLLLAEELEKLPPSMKEVLLESEDIKDIVRPGARGRQGEAARIAARYGFTPGAVRTARSRLAKRLKARFEQEVKS